MSAFIEASISKWVEKPSFRTEALTKFVKGNPGYEKPWNIYLGDKPTSGEPSKDPNESIESNESPIDPVKELYDSDQSFIM